MVWVLVVALGAGTCGYVVGDYFGFRRGKRESPISCGTSGPAVCGPSRIPACAIKP